ncbi:ABC transporter ATP-binding protein [Halobacteriales archaeon SW_7_71_33]|nr:MAG: ABC transporter ATP-binding protein [Halobacteriales archaeon SW_7_71_33]
MSESATAGDGDSDSDDDGNRDRDRESAETGRVTDGARTDRPDPLLRVEGLSKSFGGLVANDGVSLAVERGSITGLIGPNGAGKSTLFDCITGYHEPDAGTVRLDGVGVTGAPPHEIARQGLIRSFQTPRAPGGMTVREAMMVGAADQPGESLWRLFAAPGAVRDGERATLERAERTLERFEIGHLARAPATDLSGGQMKLVELARATMTDPDVLLLDEPVAGVNPTLAEKLKGFLRELNDDGITFLIIEHDMGFIMDLADTMVVLDQGSVLVEGPPEAVRNDERVVDAYLGGPRT